MIPLFETEDKYKNCKCMLTKWYQIIAGLFNNLWDRSVYTNAQEHKYILINSNIHQIFHLISYTKHKINCSDSYYQSSTSHCISTKYINKKLFVTCNIWGKNKFCAIILIFMYCIIIIKNVFLCVRYLKIKTV